MNNSESASIALGPGQKGPASTRAEPPKVISRSRVVESKLRARSSNWATDIGYWGDATTAAVSETIATDYSPPQLPRHSDWDRSVFTASVSQIRDLPSGKCKRCNMQRRKCKKGT